VRVISAILGYAYASTSVPAADSTSGMLTSEAVLDYVSSCPLRAIISGSSEGVRKIAAEAFAHPPMAAATAASDATALTVSAAAPAAVTAVSVAVAATAAAASTTAASAEEAPLACVPLSLHPGGLPSGLPTSGKALSHIGWGSGSSGGSSSDGGFCDIDRESCITGTGITASGAPDRCESQVCLRETRDLAYAWGAWAQSLPCRSQQT
jgi:hypothetical protein